MQSAPSFIDVERRTAHAQAEVLDKVDADNGAGSPGTGDGVEKDLGLRGVNAAAARAAITASSSGSGRDVDAAGGAGAGEGLAGGLDAVGEADVLDGGEDAVLAVFADVGDFAGVDCLLRTARRHAGGEASTVVVVAAVGRGSVAAARRTGSRKNDSIIIFCGSSWEV